MSVTRQHAEWLRLIDISGPFLSVPVLKDAFPQGLDAQEPGVSRRLRDGYEEWQKSPTLHRQWIRFILSEILGHPEAVLREGQAIPPSLRQTVGEHREVLVPDLVLAEPESGKARVLIQAHSRGTGLERPLPGSRWKESPAGRMAVLLRGTQVRLGLVTNGEEWMLVDAPPNATTGFATWRADIWLEEPDTLRAFRSLLGPRRLFGVAEGETLEALLAASAERQQEVTDQLGRQVRRAVEILVHALDRADRESGRTILAGVSARELYDAAVTFMMRLVFLFCAEEQGLLPLDDEQYASNYAGSTLFGQLHEAAEMAGEEVLERRTDAWQRLLATFRAIHGGVDHEGMALPPYGGHLFDPDRFPFLEGRPRESRWRVTSARPLPISNRTVLHLLSALQLLRDSKSGEAQRLSFRALDIEQIGHVYEGLLDHTVKKATAPTVSLKGKEADEPEVALDELEELQAKGLDDLIKKVAELSGRSAKAVTKDLEAAYSTAEEHALAVACENDRALLARVRPFAGLVRKDAAGLPVVIPPGSHFVTSGSDRRSTGTHYTPRSLTEPIVRYTLEPLVYVGPADGKPESEWKLKPAREILALKVCDMACGSGAFLVEACRYLSTRLVEAWTEAEAANPGKVLITPEGAMSEGRLAESIIPREDEERLAFARRLVVDRCLYGVDINPMAVEMAKLSLWLITLQKNVAFTFLDHCIRSGDSLLGVTDLRQIETLSMDPTKATAPLFLEEACRKAVARAREARQRLEGFTVKDVKDAEAKEAMLREAEEAVEVLRILGDVTLGISISRSNDTVDPLTLLSVARTALLGTGREQKEAFASLRQHARKMLGPVAHADGTPRRTLHWPLEFPETVQCDSAFDAFLGNPPFLQGKRLSSNFGMHYQQFIKSRFDRSSGAADLCAYFLRQAHELCSPYGFTGMIGTKTIAEGATMDVGLHALHQKGATIFRAFHELPWTGDAAVIISMVFLSKGPWGGALHLNGTRVAHIGANLTSDGDADHFVLAANQALCSDGVKTQGEGFIISADERAELIALHPRNASVIDKYLTGIEIAQDVGHEGSRWVINFGTMRESDARSYPEPFRILEKRVKEYRSSLTGQIHERSFWRFWDKREAFFGRMRGRGQILGCPATAKYLLMVFLPERVVPSHSVKLFAFSGFVDFALLQSAVHEVWARQRSGKLGSVLAYNLSRAFWTFPFPNARGTDLENLGSAFYGLRERISRERSMCLTDLYNALHDESDESRDLVRLRDAHAEMDQAVATAYGWTDLDLGHGFHETRQGLRFTISEPARREVLDRLLELNHQRYAEEVAQGLQDKGSKAAKGKKTSKKRTQDDSNAPLITFDEED